MRALYFEKPGGPECVKEGEVQEPIPGDDDVLIKVAAAGVNVEDLWRSTTITYAFDAYNAPYGSPYVGFECSGEVIATGSKVLTCKKGDKVCVYSRNGGAFAQVVAVPAIFVVVVPSGFSLTHAASLPQATCLTLWCFTVLRKISPGQKVLIHGGAGGRFGSIAIQYAKYIGCDVYATEVNKEKVQLCKDLGADICINCKKEDFCRRVNLETKGKGVNMIVDIIGEKYLKKNLDCLSTGGTLIIIGLQRSQAVHDLDLQILDQKKISVLGASLWPVRNEVIRRLLSKAVESVWPLISSGHIKPVIGGVFNFAAAAHALRAMLHQTVPGKILLAP